MKEFFMELVSGQGIWTALSIILIFYIIKKEENRDQKQEQREAKYQEIIDGLSTGSVKIYAQKYLQTPAE